MRLMIGLGLDVGITVHCVLYKYSHPCETVIIYDMINDMFLHSREITTEAKSNKYKCK